MTHRLVQELRHRADLTAGHGMHTSVSGAHLRAIFAELDTARAALTATSRNGQYPPPAPVWQTALEPVIPVVADILENPEHADLCGVPLLDAIQAWSARNHTTLSAAAISAIERALAGG